jgi:pyruvate kinase
MSTFGFNSATAQDSKHTTSSTSDGASRSNLSSADTVLLTLPQDNRKTKIICTLGPASCTADIIKSLLESGMNVARFNFSHGTHESHAKHIALVRECCRETGIRCAILLDTKGPEIRTGMLHNGGTVELKAGQELCIETNAGPDFVGTCNEISMDYKLLPKVIVPGNCIKIDDGLIVTYVQKIVGSKVYVRVHNSAKLGQKKGVNLPGVKVELETFLSDRDRADVLFGVEHDVDFIAVSFTRKKQDILDVREAIDEATSSSSTPPQSQAQQRRTMLIAKIESDEGLANFDGILEASDGIMVARGDLGVEVAIEEVCMAQKTMIYKCNMASKPVITATQMLQSMTVNPRPTRAESTDVANAVFDGSDCVMLSGETANGKYPIKAVQVMSRICSKAEMFVDYRASFSAAMHGTLDTHLTRPEAITSCAVKTVMDLNAPLMIALTASGSTGRYISKYKPPVPCVTVCTNQKTAHHCLVSRGLWPIVLDDELPREDVQDAIDQSVQYCIEHEWIAAGQDIVIVSGLRHGQSGGTNSMVVLPILDEMMPSQ